MSYFYCFFFQYHSKLLVTKKVLVFINKVKSKLYSSSQFSVSPVQRCMHVKLPEWYICLANYSQLDNFVALVRIIRKLNSIKNMSGTIWIEVYLFMFYLGFFLKIVLYCIIFRIYTYKQLSYFDLYFNTAHAQLIFVVV